MRKMASEILTEAELSKRWGVRGRTLREWRQKKLGPPYIQIGKKTARYRLSDVEVYEIMTLNATREMDESSARTISSEMISVTVRQLTAMARKLSELGADKAANNILNAVITFEDGLYDEDAKKADMKKIAKAEVEILSASQDGVRLTAGLADGR